MLKPTRKPARLHPVIIPAFALLAIAAIAAAGWLIHKPAKQYQAALFYPQPRIIADFALVDAGGAPFALQRLKGRWDLVFFGFTHCPDICPGTLNTLKAVRALLAESELTDAVRITLISVDPERDTPAHLAAYVAHFDDSIQAATGPEPQLRALTHQLGIIYEIEPHQPGDPLYQVDHSTGILIIDPDGRLAGKFSPPHDPQAMAADLSMLIADSVL